MSERAEVRCHACDGWIECNTADLGEIIWCPICRQKTVLELPELTENGDDHHSGFTLPEWLGPTVAAVLSVGIFAGIVLVIRKAVTDSPPPPPDPAVAVKQCIKERIKILEAFEKTWMSVKMNSAPSC